MKAAPFSYSRPADVDEACAILAADEGARLIAGGQTLVPMMAMRLARPTHLVDINRIAALSYVREDKGAVVIGATTRQCVLEGDATIAARVPLMACTIPFIGHAATRARGTIGGSLAHADPAAELPLIAITLDATVHYRAGGADGELAARDFFAGLMTTNLPEGACLTAIRFPVWQDERPGTGFQEVTARRSDFAFAAAAAQVAVDGDGKAKRVAIGVGAATESPLRLASAEEQLSGSTLDEKSVRAAVQQALADIEPLDDLHATADYRRRAAAALAVRAVADAKADALGSKTHAH
jgi:CO/xanthine dehydrogenase FAD-binding subunit